MSDIYWCEKCRQPLLSATCCNCNTSGQRIASDIRPVFPEERKLLEALFDYPEGFLMEKSVWDTNGNKLLINGSAIKVPKGKFRKTNPQVVRSVLAKKYGTINEQFNLTDFINSIKDKHRENFNNDIDLFIKCNNSRIHEIEISAFDIINEVKSRYSSSIPIVSFSGGKDSTVVSDLVRRGYANQSILHIFGDTTLELDETLQYINRFKTSNKATPFLVSKSKHNFLNLCSEIGSPTRVMRWCCTVFKTGPIGQTFEGLCRNQTIISYYGIRHSESTRRANYKAISKSPKVSRQIVVSPIINWSGADIWLYIFARKIDFNYAYRLGFARVGCWACPSNSQWSFYLTRIYHPELAEPWRDFLIGNAKVMGKPDPVEYVDSGNWKARQGGQGIVNSYKGLITSRPCGDNINAKTYSLTRKIEEDLFEYFKPFGHVELGMGRSLLGEVFIIDKKTQEPLVVLQGRTGTNNLRVKIFNSANPTLLLKQIDCQIRKYQACILCGGCPSACPVGAISDKSGKYTISEEKCNNCLKCITHYDTGCLISKVLQTKRGWT